MRKDTASGDLFAAGVAATVHRAPVPRREQAVAPLSVSSHREGIMTLGKRAGAILLWLKAAGEHTDREVMRGMGFSDMNSVRPRITELIDAKLVVECGTRFDPHTNRVVRVVRLA